MTGPVEIRPEEFDPGRWVRPGDTVLWGQACAEPVTLAETLMARRASVGGRFRVLLGIGLTGTARPEHADVVDFVGYTGGGPHHALVRAGVLDVLPVHYSQFPALFSRGPLAADVVLVQVAPPGPDGRYSFGAGQEYLPRAIDTARVVIAEVNDQAPRTRGGRALGPADVDVVVPISRPLASVQRSAPSPVEERIAGHVAGIVEDGSTVQLGLGGLPEAILARLTDRRDLGIHSGLISDAVMELMQAGVVTNARKTRDAGISVAGLLMGTEALFRFADDNPAVELRETADVHGAEALADQERFVAINSAIEVDLSGQVNAETARGQYIGAVGGAGDFLRAAARSRGGLPIIALPSTAGPASRIVAELSGPVSTPRSDVGLVVTEYGVADLRGLPLRERRERLIAIAHPDHQARLDAAGPVAQIRRREQQGT
jgi:acyl-CoA hydrolase